MHPTTPANIPAYMHPNTSSNIPGYVEYLDPTTPSNIQGYMHPTTPSNIPGYMHPTTPSNIPGYMHPTTPSNIPGYLHPTTPANIPGYIHPTTPSNIPGYGGLPSGHHRETFTTGNVWALSLCSVIFTSLLENLKITSQWAFRSLQVHFQPKWFICSWCLSLFFRMYTLSSLSTNWNISILRSCHPVYLALEDYNLDFKETRLMLEMYVWT